MSEYIDDLKDAIREQIEARERAEAERDELKNKLRRATMPGESEERMSESDGGGGSASHAAAVTSERLELERLRGYAEGYKQAVVNQSEQHTAEARAIVEGKDPSTQRLESEPSAVSDSQQSESRPGPRAPR